jgi:large subunit ribosomal protein L29
MELKELKAKTGPELTKLLKEQREKLRELRFKDANKQLKNVREIRSVKRTIARVLTLMKRPAAAPKSEAAPAVKTV